MADAPDLGSGAARRESSSLSSCTEARKQSNARRWSEKEWGIRGGPLAYKWLQAERLVERAFAVLLGCSRFMKIAVGPSTRFLLLALVGACSRRPTSGVIAERDGTDGAAAPPAGSVPDPAPTFADPMTPPPGPGPYEHPFLRNYGDGRPRGRASISETEISGGVVTNADRVVAGMRAGFRACYNRGLATDSEQSGSLRIAAKLDANGGVTNATAERAGSLSQDTTDCVLRRVQSASFGVPNADHVSVRFSVSFDQEPDELGDGGPSRR